MQRIIPSALMVCALYALVLPGAAQLGLNQALAQERVKKPSERKTRKAPTLSLQLHEKLQKAQQLSEADDRSGAISILDELRAPKKYQRYNSYEKAMLWNFYAFIYYGNEDYANTERAYKKVLEQRDLPEGLYVGALYSLAQIYFVRENYKGAVTTLEQWFKVAQNPNASAYILLGQGYYQMKEYLRAIPAVEKAIEINRSKQREVQESWYLLLRAMYYQREDYPRTLQVMRTLVTEYPKKEYYSQLSAMYGELRQEFNRYSTVAAMNDAAMLTKGAELLSYAQLLMLNERPFRAAVILEKGLKTKVIEEKESTYKLLGNAWTLAREDDKAIPALESAARLSKTGDVYVTLGQSYLNVENWAKSVEVIEKAFKKGHLKRADKANFWLGMAYFNLKKYRESIKAFKKATEDKRSEKIATQWIRYVQSERDRAKELEKALI